MTSGGPKPTRSSSHQGNDPANKAAEPPHVAGLMVRAADTGRVLMLQRSMTEDDPAAGRWEPPGGHAEPGETLLMAALREFSEETGMVAPRGTLAGSWDASNGIYRGFVITVPSEDAVPVFGGRDQVWDPDDPHGDHTQAIAWFDPAEFAGNPSMRPEMAADLPLVMAALAGDAAKSARTPMLEITPRILGPEGLWHTPDRHVGGKQKLPDYIEQVAGALMDQQGMGESQAIATAINAIKRWAAGDLHWGHYKITPEVIVCGTAPGCPTAVRPVAKASPALRRWRPSATGPPGWIRKKAALLLIVPVLAFGAG